MSKLWLVAEYEFKRHVFKKSFILALISLPLVITLMIGLVWFAAQLKSDDTPLGYVDHSGFLANPIAPPQRGSSPDEPSTPAILPLISYPTEEQAGAALEAGQIQAYYVVSANYTYTRRVDLVYISPPDYAATSQFWDFMQINHLADLPPEIAQRAVSGSNLIMRWPDGSREFSQRAFLSQFAPIFVGFAFALLLFMSGPHLMSTIVEEKENRMAEILSTMLSPGQLMAGKISAVVAMNLIQLLAWIAFVALAVVIGGDCLDVKLLQNLKLEWGLFAPLAVLFVPAYVMYAALLSAVGASISEAQEAQQMTALFIVPMGIPMWVLPLIVENSNGPLSLALSFFPLTSLSTYSLRLLAAPVPRWQFAVSILIFCLCAVGAVWLAGRALRLGMLRYGQRLNWRELLWGAQ